MKKIGILTSGGDCGGLNAAIRSIFFRAKNKYNMSVVGIINGTSGFLGTTNKGNPFNFSSKNGKKIDQSKQIIEGYRQLGLDGLIIIGGDGSMQILQNLAKKGDLNIVAIPKTIDNDVGATDSSIGFDTAVHVATQALDNLHSTAVSHSRSMILEVMGRDAGHIALSAGIAGGADVILIPEIKYSVN